MGGRVVRRGARAARRHLHERRTCRCRGDAARRAAGRRRRRVHVGSRRHGDARRRQPHAAGARPEPADIRAADALPLARDAGEPGRTRARRPSCSRSRASTPASTSSGARVTDGAGPAGDVGEVARRRAACGARRKSSTVRSGSPSGAFTLTGRAWAGARYARVRTLVRSAPVPIERDLDVELPLDELDVASRRVGQVVDRRAAVERLLPARAASRTRAARRGSRSGAPGSRASPRRRAAGSGRRRAARRSARARRASSARAGRCRSRAPRSGARRGRASRSAGSRPVTVPYSWPSSRIALLVGPLDLGRERPLADAGHVRLRDADHAVDPVRRRCRRPSRRSARPGSTTSRTDTCRGRGRAASPARPRRARPCPRGARGRRRATCRSTYGRSRCA